MSSSVVFRRYPSHWRSMSTVIVSSSQRFASTFQNHHHYRMVKTANACSCVRVRVRVRGHTNSLDRRRYVSSSSSSNNDDEDTEALLSSFANLDHGREKRTGFPEAIFAQGKSPYQIAKILDDMAGHINDNSYSNAILATRVDPELYQKVASYPLENGTLTYHETARIISMQANTTNSSDDDDDDEPLESWGKVVVASAGTTDLYVAEEAAVTLEATGKVEVERVYDAGVAGLHRILKALPKLRHPDVKCILVCAGMDGALPSVVSGLVSVPVVAIPTSIGYGASFGGVSALLTMLNTCSPGVGVVNIDNGFGGAALAYKFISSSHQNSPK